MKIAPWERGDGWSHRRKLPLTLPGERQRYALHLDKEAKRWRYVVYSKGDEGGTLFEGYCRSRQLAEEAAEALGRAVGYEVDDVPPAHGGHAERE